MTVAAVVVLVTRVAAVERGQQALQMAAVVAGRALSILPFCLQILLA